MATRAVARETARTRVARLRELGYPIVQASIAAAASWALAHDAIGHPRAFFAPIAALIAIGVASSNRTRRVIELTLGVAVGIGVGDLLIYRIGSGAWQVGVATLAPSVSTAPASSTRSSAAPSGWRS